MPTPGQPFTDDDLAELLSVSVETVAVWDENGDGPEFFEQHTPDGVKRFYTAEAIRDWCLKHRTFPAANSALARAGRPTGPDDGSLIGGGEFASAKS